MADEWDQKTVVTFSEPVEIPGVHLAGWGVLPAGSYVFKLMGSESDRNIVQIFNKAETTIYATILAVPNYRLKATGKTVITFDERPAGQPEALRAWFYPGSKTGEEFVYPKAKALILAQASKSAVPFTDMEIPAEVAAPPAAATEPTVVAMKSAPVKALQPSGEESDIAEPATLPKTASGASLFGLIGLVSIGAALALRSGPRKQII